MRRVLLFATTTGYQIRSFGAAAERLGVRLVFASDRCDQLEDPWWDGAIPVRFYDERRSLRTIVETLAGAPPAGVIAVGDRPVVLAARAAEALGLPGNVPAAARTSRHKLATRRALARAGLPTPRFAALPLDGDPIRAAATVGFPLVVKPLALSGSRGVMRANDAGELHTAFARLRRLLASADVRAERDPAHAGALVETFVPGREFAVEGVLTRGRLHPLAIFDKPDPLDGPFFEETLYVTPSRSAAGECRRIVEAVAAAAAAIGLTHGPVHAECRVNPTGVFVLEVAARPIGGLCARALRFKGADRPDDSGRTDLVSLEELLLRHAIGEDVARFARETAASGVMMIPIPARGVLRRVHGVDAARAVAGVDDVQITARPDARLVPLPEGRSYLGFIFARGSGPVDVERALREAHGRLQFTIDREVPLHAAGPAAG